MLAIELKSLCIGMINTNEMTKKLFIGLLLSFAVQIIHGQWKSINPGAGGQVQDVICDPNQPNRLLLASDMEGIYESIDNGISWHPKGELMHNRVYAITVSPGNSKKLFVGTLFGLEVSTDGGNSFRFIASTRRKSIGVIAVHPTNPNLVIAGMGWRDDTDFTRHFGLEQNGKGELFRSIDGGKTWSTIYFDTDESTDRNVFTIQFDSRNPNRVYLGSAKGVFKSEDKGINWNELTKPINTEKNYGASISPDGKIIYAVYSIKGRIRNIYASSTERIDWISITEGSGVLLGNKDYWYPEVDSRSTGSDHTLTVSLQGGRDGLFEGFFKWNKDGLSSYYWNTIWSGVGGFDTGWDNAHTNPRFVHYTPPSWDRAIWSTTNQTIFQGTPNKWGYDWNNRYCIPNYDFQIPHWETLWPTYSSRGTESTYTYDLAIFKNYILQGQADNGLVESWDYGKSWSNIQHRRLPMNLSDVQAVDISITSDGTPVAIAQATGGYGGNAVDGRLYVKELKTLSPKDKWIFLAGGPEEKAGLGSGVLRDLAVSPIKKDRIFLFSTGKGMYIMDDFGEQIEKVKNGSEASCKRISNGILEKVTSVKKIAPHPLNENIVFLTGSSGNQGVYRGELKGESWEWNKIYNGYSWDAEIVTWEHMGQVYLFYSGVSEEKQGDGTNFIGALSLDEGQTWKTVMNKKKAIKLRKNIWLEELKEDYRFLNKGGIIGYQNQVIMGYYDHRMQKAYGIFKGTIGKKGKVVWEDWTGDIPYGGLTSAIYSPVNGVPHVLVSTAGAGAWIRPLVATEKHDTPPMGFENK